MSLNIVIVGAGLAGLASAWALQQRGHRVCVVERAARTGESSWAGAGILSPLLPWHYPAAVNALCSASMQRYAEWSQCLHTASDIDPEYWPCGMAIHAATVPPAARDWCADHGMSLIETATGYALPQVAQVRNPRLVAALRAALQRGGAAFFESEALAAVLPGGSGRQTLRLSQRDLDCDRLVIATGAWSGQPLPGLAAPVQVRPVRGQMLLFRAPPGVLDHIVYHDGLYVVPRRDGHLLVGSTLEDAGFDKTTDSATAARLHAHATPLLPALAGLTPIQHWAGLRPGSPDNVPLIDRHPDFAQVYLNVGHFRYGVTMAPAAAAHLADLIEERPTALDPAPYRWAAMAARSALVLP